jgi:uncharacterized protein YkwD
MVAKGVIVNTPIEELSHRLSVFARAICLMALAVSLAACAGPQPIPASRLPEHKSKPHVRIVDLEKKIHALINRERQRYGLRPLAWAQALAVIARKHSRDMARRKYFDHLSPDGHDFSYRYRKEGYSCAVTVRNVIYTGAENIALNNLYDSVTTVNGEAFYDWNSSDKIAETTVKGWMNSPGHRKNILAPHWRNEGIGVVVSPDDKVYITQNFC